jgi:hypothetical protein
MNSYGDEPLDGEFMSDTDGDMQLVACDADAHWVVVEQQNGGAPKVLRQHAAEGEIAYYRGLSGHPAWSVSRGGGRSLFVFAAGRRFPKLFGQPGALERTDSFLTDATSMQRSVLEAASWRLAAELCRRHPDRLRIYELHPGGGQYDCLSIAAVGDDPRSLVQLNRHGSIHVEGRWDSRKPQIESRAWSAYFTEDPYLFVRTLEDDIALRPPPEVPPTAEHTLVYRLLAAAAAADVLGVRRRRIVNGYFDSSGEPCRARNELFADFPAADRRRSDPSAERPLGVAEYRFWFVLDAGRPAACFDIAGVGWDAAGAEVDLLTAYQQCGRRLGVMLATSFPDLAG